MDYRRSYAQWVDGVVIVVFLGSLILPFTMWLLQADISFSEVEKRELHGFPSFAKQQSIAGFTTAFDSYYQDHFGLREWFIHRYQRETEKRFGISGTPDVMNGSDGWLFFARSAMLNDLKGRLQFTDEEKNRFWMHIQDKAAWLKKKGAAYIFLVAPNKQSVYPEYLPSFYKAGHKSGRLDQLLAVSPSQNDDVFLDVRESLCREKENERLYNKSDTHWNAMGAYYAYLAVRERTMHLFPSWSGQGDFSFLSKWKSEPGGDLAVMIGKGKSIKELKPVLETKRLKARQVMVSHELLHVLALTHLQPYYTINQSRSLRVLILHDSFGEVLKPFISEDYGHAFYIRTYYDNGTIQFFTDEVFRKVLSLYKPDLVIEVLVERNLQRFVH